MKAKTILSVVLVVAVSAAVRVGLKNYFDEGSGSAAYHGVETVVTLPGPNKVKPGIQLPERQAARFIRDRDYLLGLLKSERYGELHSTLTAGFGSVDKYMDQWFGPFHAFETPDPAATADLGKWIKAQPDSFMAYFARALHHRRIGWIIRGTNGPKKTTQVQFEGLQKQHLLALRDLAHVVKLKPDFGMAYALQLELLQGLGNRKSLDKIFEVARMRAKNSPYFIALYLDTLYMAGDLRTLETFVKQMQRSTNGDPSYVFLNGLYESRYADIMQARGDDREAVVWAEKARAIRTDAYRERRRAWQLFDANDCAAALIAAEKSINLNFRYLDAYITFVHMARKCAQQGKAFAVLEFGISVFPFEPALLRGRADMLADMAYGEKANPAKAMPLAKRAIADYRRATLNWSHYAHLHASIGQLEAYVLRDFDGAIASYKSALSQSGDNRKYWLSLARALYDNKDCRAKAALKAFQESCKIQGGCPGGRPLEIDIRMRSPWCEGSRKIAEGAKTKPKVDISHQVARMSVCKETFMAKPVGVAIEACRARADRGDRAAMFDMALFYFPKAGVKGIKPAGAKWLQKASARGHVRAHFMLGVAYIIGQPVKADHKKGLALLEKAVEGKSLEAMFFLGLAYVHGLESFKADKKKGVGYLEMAARRGHPLAEQTIQQIEARSG